MLGLLAIGFHLALLERWELSGRYLWAIFAELVVAFVGFSLAGYRVQLSADAALTNSEADHAAAREALGYAYRAQRAKSRAEKWLFFAGELRGRAGRLGIDLDAETTS